MATPEATLGTATRPQYAGLGARLGAYVIDLLIAFAVLIAVSLTMRSLRAFGVWTPAPVTLSPAEEWMSMTLGRKLLVIIGFLIASGAIQGILLQSSPWQASLGKRWLNIYVTDGAGRRITVGRSFGRWMARWFIDVFGGWVASLVTVAATPKKKALHDYVVNTVVVSGRPIPEVPLGAWRLPAIFGFAYVSLVLIFAVSM